jgi:hypothetical protein
MTIWPMLTACWITKATDTHSEYVIFITFPLQEKLPERYPMLRDTYIAFLVHPPIVSLYIALLLRSDPEKLSKAATQNLQ